MCPVPQSSPESSPESSPPNTDGPHSPRAHNNIQTPDDFWSNSRAYLRLSRHYVHTVLRTDYKCLMKCLMKSDLVQMGILLQNYCEACELLRPSTTHTHAKGHPYASGNARSGTRQPPGTSPGQNERPWTRGKSLSILGLGNLEYILHNLICKSLNLEVKCSTSQ